MMNWGFLCLKQEMTQMFLNDKMEAVTLLKFLDDQEVIRIKTQENDGYNAVVIWAGKKEKNWKTTYKYIKEFKVENVDEYKVWDKISMNDNVDKVTVKSTTKWKGFQWVMKRFWFGWWRKTHGSKFHRTPWSIGNRKPRRVNKNHPLPWHMWYKNVTVKNVNIIATYSLPNSDNILVAKWSIPGSRNSLIRIIYN